MPHSVVDGDEEIVTVDGQSFRRPLPRRLTKRVDNGMTISEMNSRPPGARDPRARLLDLVPRRWAPALKTWWSAQTATFRDQVQVVAMDGSGGYKTAATEQLPEAIPVMDPFHVVALAGLKLDLCRQRVQQQMCGHRGRSGDPVYGSDAPFTPGCRC